MAWFRVCRHRKGIRSGVVSESFGRVLGRVLYFAFERHFFGFVSGVSGKVLRETVLLLSCPELLAKVFGESV